MCLNLAAFNEKGETHTHSIARSGSSIKQDKNRLHRTVMTPERIIGANLPCIQDLWGYKPTATAENNLFLQSVKMWNHHKVVYNQYIKIATALFHCNCLLFIMSIIFNIYVYKCICKVSLQGCLILFFYYHYFHYPHSAMKFECRQSKLNHF